MGAEGVLVGLRVRGFRTELDCIQRRDVAAEGLEGEDGDFVADVAVVPAIMSGMFVFGKRTTTMAETMCHVNRPEVMRQQIYLCVTHPETTCFTSQHLGPYLGA
jgi:hypothetical protein